MIPDKFFGCIKKKRFVSRKAAKDSRKKNVIGISIAEKLIPYKCQFCDGFHLTSKVKK